MFKVVSIFLYGLITFYITKHDMSMTLLGKVWSIGARLFKLRKHHDVVLFVEVMAKKTSFEQ